MRTDRHCRLTSGQVGLAGEILGTNQYRADKTIGSGNTRNAFHGNLNPFSNLKYTIQPQGNVCDPLRMTSYKTQKTRHRSKGRHAALGQMQECYSTGVENLPARPKIKSRAGEKATAASLNQPRGVVDPLDPTF